MELGHAASPPCHQGKHSPLCSLPNVMQHEVFLLSALLTKHSFSGLMFKAGTHICSGVIHLYGGCVCDVVTIPEQQQAGGLYLKSHVETN